MDLSGARAFDDINYKETFLLMNLKARMKLSRRTFLGAAAASASTWSKPTSAASPAMWWERTSAIRSGCLHRRRRPDQHLVALVQQLVAATVDQQQNIKARRVGPNADVDRRADREQ